MKPRCVTRQLCSWSCKLWLNHTVTSLGLCLSFLTSGTRQYEWRLTFDHFISSDWSKTSVSCRNWFTSNGFITAIKASAAAHWFCFQPAHVCFEFQFGEMTWPDVAPEFSKIFQGLFLLVLLIDWTICRPAGSHLVSHVPVCTLLPVPLLSPVTSWWRWWRCRTAANRRRSVATKRPSSALPLTPKMTTWWVITFSPNVCKSAKMSPRQSIMIRC